MFRSVDPEKGAEDVLLGVPFHFVCLSLGVSSGVGAMGLPWVDLRKLLHEEVRDRAGRLSKGLSNSYQLLQ